MENCGQMSDVLLQTAQWLAEANSAIAFTGAGVSTESGIPDFRSPGGVWSRYRTVYFQEFLESADARLEYWRQPTPLDSLADVLLRQPIGETLAAIDERLHADPTGCA